MGRIENKIQDNIQEYLNKHRIFNLRFNTTTKFGVPDILVCYRGYTVGLEVKDPKGKGTDLQAKTIEVIRASEGFADFVTSVEEVRLLFDKIDLHIKRLSRANT